MIRNSDKITLYILFYCWFYSQMCEGGTVVDLVNGLLLQNKKMKEEHIGYILRELVKVRTYNNNSKRFIPNNSVW